MWCDKVMRPTNFKIKYILSTPPFAGEHFDEIYPSMFDPYDNSSSNTRWKHSSIYEIFHSETSLIHTRFLIPSLYVSKFHKTCGYYEFPNIYFQNLPLFLTAIVFFQCCLNISILLWNASWIFCSNFHFMGHHREKLYLPKSGVFRQFQFDSFDRRPTWTVGNSRRQMDK